jgi:hypothetical protein
MGVQVHSDDFKKLNEFAESAWVCRDPGNADSIKETRRRLLAQVRLDKCALWELRISFGLKILEFLDADPSPGSWIFFNLAGSGIRNGKI